MNGAAAFRLVEYEQKYATAAVGMWRASKRKVPGIENMCSFADQLRFLNGTLVEENAIFLEIR